MSYEVAYGFFVKAFGQHYFNFFFKDSVEYVLKTTLPMILHRSLHQSENRNKQFAPTLNNICIYIYSLVNYVAMQLDCSSLIKAVKLSFCLIIKYFALNKCFNV